MVVRWPSANGWVKLGQPVPLSNLAPPRNSGSSPDALGDDASRRVPAGCGVGTERGGGAVGDVEQFDDPGAGRQQAEAGGEVERGLGLLGHRPRLDDDGLLLDGAGVVEQLREVAGPAQAHAQRVPLVGVGGEADRREQLGGRLVAEVELRRSGHTGPEHRFALYVVGATGYTPADDRPAIGAAASTR